MRQIKFEFNKSKMQQSLKNQDCLTLHHIVSEADKKYLKQSRINKHSSSSGLNLLRILSAFKDLFPSTPERIYKLIMVITKNHNPQTREQWNKAIQKLQNLQVKKTRSSISMLQNQSPIIHNQSASLLPKHNNPKYQSSIKTYKQQLDHQVDTITSKRSRVKFISDFRTTEPVYEQFNENKQNLMFLSNKNSINNSHIEHYISFEPHHRDSIKDIPQQTQYFVPSTTQYVYPKQKSLCLKKINPYHQITRIDNLSRIQDQQLSSKDQSKTFYSQNYRTQQNSCCCIPSKTQRDSSQRRFILLDSKDSQISIKKSHLIRTQNHQEISEYEHYNMTVEEWESLNQKASTFHSFNIKLKGFSALLANYQAFQSDRFIKNKAKIFNHCYLQSKVFIALKTNIQFQRQIKQKNQKAQSFYNENLSKKVWKILQVMKNMRVRKPKNYFQIEKLNKINFEFLMSFMFAQKPYLQTLPNKIGTQLQLTKQFEFENKIQYFSRTQNFQNIYDIYKCFGLNINITKEKIAQFFQKYHQCMLKQTFQIFKKNLQNQKEKYLKLHKTRLVQKAFSILLSKRQIGKQMKKKIFLADCHAKNKLKQKTYKILLSIVYSTKIFSKRQQFIQSQSKNRIKLNIFKKWCSEYKNKHLERKIKTNELNKLYSSLFHFIMKRSFGKIIQQSLLIQNKILKVQHLRTQLSKQRLFTQLSQFVRKRKIVQTLFQKGSQILQRKILSKWLRFIRIKQSLVKISKSYNKIIFRNLFVPINQDIKQDYYLNRKAQKITLKQYFSEWRSYQQNKQKIRKQCEEKVKTMIIRENSKNFIDMLKENVIENQLIRAQRQCRQKTQILENQLISSGKNLLIQNMKRNFQENSNREQKVHSLSILIKKNSLQHFLSKIQQSKLLKLNSSHLNAYLKVRNFENICILLEKNQQKEKYERLKLKAEKKIFTKFLAQISQGYNNLKNLQKISQIHFREKNYRKVLLIFANILIDTTQKTHQLQEFLRKQRKKQYFDIFKQRTCLSIQTKSKMKIVQKKQFFTCLRENLTLKNNKQVLEKQLDQRKRKNFFINLESFIQQKESLNEIEENQRLCTKRIFLMRFDQYFIESLFQKKHSFMAYKFRALKLYSIAFKSWKDNTRTNKKIMNNKKQSKSLEKQRFLNHRQKQFIHMYKPTDCSLISK